MSASTRFEAIFPRRYAHATFVALAIAVVLALGVNALPARAASTVKSRFADVASGATRVVVDVNRGLNAKANRHSVVTTTTPATIAAIIRRVNTLPPAPSVAEMCPMDVGATLTVNFFRHAATPYAVVVADPGGCGRVSIRDYNANGTLEGSATAGGGAAFSAYVATVLHIKTLQVL